MTELPIAEALGRRRPKHPERRIQDQILTMLRYRRIFAFHIPNHGLLSRRTGRYNKVGQFHVAGVPDLAVVLPAGRMLWIEVKSQVGRQSLEQKDVERRLQDLGHVYLLARSLQDVLDWLTANDAIVRPEAA